MFFKRIDTSFLLDESQRWINNSACKSGANIVAHVCIVNDTVERGVKSNEECNGILIHDDK